MNLLNAALHAAKPSWLSGPLPPAPATEGSSPPPAAECQAYVAVGGCNGLVLLGVDELPDFYRAHGYVALLGLAMYGLVNLLF